MSTHSGLPVSWKLTAMIAVTSVAALGIGMGTMSRRNIGDLRRALQEEAGRTATVFGDYSAGALAFDAPDEAAENLALLQRYQSIEAARLFDDRGETFATWEREQLDHDIPLPERLEARVTALDVQWRSRCLDVYAPVGFRGEPFGAVLVRWSTSAFEVQVRSHLVTLGYLTAGLALLVVLFAVVVQRGVSRPILELARTARSFSENADFSVRVRPTGDREIRALGEGLNAMLAAIEQREQEQARLHAEIDRQNRELEKRVAERTAELRAKSAALESSNQQLRQFAYVSSHDLKEPLRMVASYCQLLERRYKGQIDEKADRWLGFAVEGAKRMDQLIDDLLTYSRVENQEKVFENADMGQLCDQALENLAATIAEIGAVVTRGELPTVWGVPSLLQQVLQNLIANGIKFRGDEPPRVEVTAERDGGLWTISVRDNGIGIEPEYRDRIFEIFKRLHDRTEYAGTGIGLAICRRVVDHHGGTIWVESAEPRGCVFRFTVPDGRERAGERKGSPGVPG